MKKINLKIIVILTLLLPAITFSAQTNLLMPPIKSDVIFLCELEYLWGDLPVSSDPGQNRTIWDIHNTWNKISLPSVPEGRDGTNWLWKRVRLPDSNSGNDLLLIKTVDQIFEIYAQGKKIYQFGDLDKPVPDSFIGYSGHLIRVPPGSGGEWLYIRIYSEYASIGVFTDLIYSPMHNMLKYLFLRELDSLITGSFFIMIGFLVLVFAFFGSLVKFKIEIHSFTIFGLLQLNIGLIVFSQLMLKSVLIYNPIFWMRIDLLTIYAMPILVYAFYESMITSLGKKVIRIFWIMHTLFLGLAILLEFAGVYPLHMMLKPYEYLLLATVSVMVVSIVHNLIRGNIEVRLFSLGILSLVGFGIYDILGDMKLVVWNRSILHWGMLLFTFSLILIIIRRFRELAGKLSANEKELEIAQLVQKEVLPSEISLEQFADLEIVVSYIPHTGNVSGDYYSISPIRGGIASIAIADATGHGIQAALSTMQIDVLMKENKDIMYPHEKLASINNILTQQIGGKNFFTVFFMNIYPGYVEYSSAGHPEQYIYHTKQNILSRVNTKGRPLGLMDDLELEMKSESLEPGDYIILFSDGMFEIFNDKEQQLGLDGLHDMLTSIFNQKENIQDPKHIEQIILKRLRSYVKGEGFQDDLTLIVIKLKDS